jgi:hypothetical protein
MLIQTQVGPVATTASAAPGTLIPGRAGQLGDTIVSELHGRYYETTYRRNLFNAANQAATTTTVGLATVYTGLCLSNPVGSTVNLILTKIGFSFIVAFPAAAAIGLMAGYNSGTNVTHTTPGTPRNMFFGAGAAGQGLVDTAATLPTAPFVTHVFGSGYTGAITTTPQVSPTIIDLEGGLLLPPGGYAAIYTSTVSGTSGFFGSMIWEEVPA